MNTFIKVSFLSLLVLGLSSCGHRYGMYHSESYRYTHVYERPLYPTVYVETPYLGYSRSYVGSYPNYYDGGRMGGGGMH